MEVSEFEVGKMYTAKRLDWESPMGEICRGKVVNFEVLPPRVVKDPETYDKVSLRDREEELQQFLHVTPVGKELSYLLHPSTLEWACEI